MQKKQSKKICFIFYKNLPRLGVTLALQLLSYGDGIKKIQKELKIPLLFYIYLNLIITNYQVKFKLKKTLKIAMKIFR